MKRRVNIRVPGYGVRRLTFAVVVAEGGGPHVAEADGALAAAVGQGVAVLGVELC